MKVRALRGVCVGVDRHLKPTDIIDLEPSQVPFLVGIHAVEIVIDDPPAEPESAAESVSALEQDVDSVSDPDAPPTTTPETKPNSKPANRRA